LRAPLEEHFKAEVAKEYDELSTRYEHRWRRYVSRSVEETVRRTNLQDGDSILDVGCGTGALLRGAMT
jgi:ubiquinone/menaquinone biosynthesis C-methylase UbiE